MSRLSLFPPPRPTAFIVVFVAFALQAAWRPAPALGETPADPLLRLVPADAGATLVVERLKGSVREVLDSPVYDGLSRLPVVREWFKSGRFRRFSDALDKVEKALGVKAATLRDDLLGEAFVLTLRVPPGRRPEEAKGLLLVRVPDQSLLDRVIARVNTDLTDRGELRRVSERSRGGTSYQVREFPPGRRDVEYYAALKGRVFVWSNSEELIQGAIDRQASATGSLPDEPAFRAVREGLPARAAATLYVDPRFLAGIMEASASTMKPGEERTFALAGRYLAAVRYLGIAALWRDGLVFQSREVLDPEKLDPGLRRWAARRETPDAVLRRVPPSALLVASLPVDAAVVHDALADLVAPQDRAKLANIREALKGIMYGLDVRDEVAAQLGPGLVAYLERPDTGDRNYRFPVVIALEVVRSPAGQKAGAALANALRTLLALHALDPKNGATDATIETKTAAGAEVTALSAKSPFAFAVNDGRLVLGTSAGAVARALSSQADPNAGGVFVKFRDRLFPGATGFVCADLKAFHEYAVGARPALAARLAAGRERSPSDAAKDLDQALALLNVFDVAFLSGTVEPSTRAVNRTLGLVRLGTATKR